MLQPIGRALEQLDDPVFLSVLARSIGLAVLCFLVLLGLCAWGAQVLVGQHGWLGWVAGVAGGLGAAAAAVWLFVPVAVVIAALFSDRVAAAVERRFYPSLPPAAGGASLAVQGWDALALGLAVLGLQVLTFLLALALPGVGLVAGYVVAGWAIGRGLFVTVAMRRMSRPEALALYGRQRWGVLLQGTVLALAGTIPLLNLLVPVLGIAALTHVLHQRAPPAGPGAPGPVPLPPAMIGGPSAAPAPRGRPNQERG